MHHPKIMVQSVKGSKPQKWVQVPQERCGSSLRTSRRVAITALAMVEKTMEGRPSFIATNIYSKVASQLNVDCVMKHVKGRPLLISSAADQMMIQLAGGMTNR